MTKNNGFQKTITMKMMRFQNKTSSDGDNYETQYQNRSMTS